MLWIDFGEIFKNPVLTCAVLAWLIAQGLKVLLSMMIGRKMDFRRFVSSGGMPSSHAATVMSMTTAVGLRSGFDSTLFAVAFTVSMIIMYDAAGVRRAAGKQAAALNRIIDHMKTQGVRNVMHQHPFKELLGHTPVEVFAGALLGIVVAACLM